VHEAAATRPHRPVHAGEPGVRPLHPHPGLPRIYVHLLTHPEAVEHVLQKNHRNYRKPDFFNRTVGLLAGNGILTSEGDFWLRQRRLMQPAFHRQHLAKLVPLMVAAAEAFQPDETNGFAIPAKGIVTVNQFITHRHPDFWDEPGKFKPERFLPGQAEGRHKFAFFPFGGASGLHRQHLRHAGGAAVLATIVQRFRVELVPGQAVVPDPNVHLAAQGRALKVTLWPR